MALTSEILPFCLVAVSVTHWFIAGAEVMCPDRCICSFNMSLVVIECTGKNLTSLPYPSGFEEDDTNLKVDLYLNRNRFGYILRHSFFSITGKLRVLEITENEQRIEIANSAFEPFTRSLEVLRLDPLPEDLNSQIVLFSSLASLVELTISSRSEGTEGQVLFKPLFRLDSNPLLQVLELHHCGLRDITDGAFGQLRLDTLNLRNNKFAEIPRVVTSMAATSLTHLYMSNNDIVRVRYDHIPDRCKLQVLDLSFNKVVAIDRDALGKCSHLHVVNLSHNAHLVKVDFGVFDGLMNLIIDLDHTSISCLDFVQPDQVRVMRIEGSKIPCSCELQLKQKSVFGDRLRGTCVKRTDIASGWTDHEVSYLDLECKKQNEEQVMTAEESYCNMEFGDCIYGHVVDTSQTTKTPLPISQTTTMLLSSHLSARAETTVRLIDRSSISDTRSREVTSLEPPGENSVIFSLNPTLSTLSVSPSVPTEGTASTMASYLMSEVLPQSMEREAQYPPVPALSETTPAPSLVPSLQQQFESTNLAQNSLLVPQQSESETREKLHTETGTSSLAHKTPGAMPILQAKQKQVETIEPLKLPPRTAMNLEPQIDTEKMSEPHVETAIVSHQQTHTETVYQYDLNPVLSQAKVRQPLEEAAPQPLASKLSDQSEGDKLVQLTFTLRSSETQQSATVPSSWISSSASNFDSREQFLDTNSARLRVPAPSTRPPLCLFVPSKKEKAIHSSQSRIHVQRRKRLMEARRRQQISRTWHSRGRDRFQKINKNAELWILSYPICALFCFIHASLTFAAFLTPEHGRTK